MGVAGRGTSSQAPWMRGLHELSAAGDDNSIRKADGGFMLRVELSSELCEGLSSRLVTPKLPKYHPVRRSARTGGGGAGTASQSGLR